ncbi:MAG: hypothetical protein ABJB66_07525 [Gemmatimonadaceae bacterium]
MNTRFAQRIVASVRKASSARAQAAREALALCETFNSLGHTAAINVQDSERFSELLQQRDDVLAELNDHLLVLRLERPCADGPQYAGAERAADTADDLIMQVRESLEASVSATAVLTARVAERAGELRQEIAAVNRAGSAQSAYGSNRKSGQFDSLR